MLHEERKKIATPFCMSDFDGKGNALKRTAEDS
jgi:hypothetical protein